MRVPPGLPIEVDGRGRSWQNGVMTPSKSLLFVLAGIGLTAFGLSLLTRTEAPLPALPQQESPSRRGESLDTGSGVPTMEPARGAEAEPSAAPMEPSGVPMRGPDQAKAELPAELGDSLKLLRSPDPEDRISAIASLIDLDPQVAERELEALLRGPEEDDDVRIEAFTQLKDLSQDRKTVAVLVEGLHDRSAVVRSEAALLLQFEDLGSDDRVVPALREALRRERDPDVRDELEAALENVDPTGSADAGSNPPSTATSAADARPGPS